jgi:hypothetical protein
MKIPLDIKGDFVYYIQARAMGGANCDDAGDCGEIR